MDRITTGKKARWPENFHIRNNNNNNKNKVFFWSRYNFKFLVFSIPPHDDNVEGNESKQNQ